MIAGYIDAHRHLVRRPPDLETAPGQMRELLEAGFTTVQSGGDDNASIVELKRRIERGEVKGPRILAAWRDPIMTMKTEEEVRAAVRAAKAGGADSIAELHYPGQGAAQSADRPGHPQPDGRSGRGPEDRPADPDPRGQPGLDRRGGGASAARS